MGCTDHILSITVFTGPVIGSEDKGPHQCHQTVL
uniref:Uncharacterized protein n=1 Tax=Anguilla anguilla TaxID=7936 RepID=A0A0E9SUS2_ANGAN